MDIPQQAYPAIGVVIASFIAGTISFVNVILSKEQKTSEFRQSWIDALRNDIADFVAITTIISSFFKIKIAEGGNSLQQYIESRHDDLLKKDVLLARIKLRLNPIEHAKLLCFIKDVDSLYTINQRKLSDLEHVITITDALVEESQKVLKCEWALVKRGEWPFVLTKWLSLLAVVLTSFIVLLWAEGYIHFSLVPK